MPNLTHASRELFRRPPDERFASLDILFSHCQDMKLRSRRIKEPGASFSAQCHDGDLALKINGYAPLRLNEWSFGQLCALAGVSKDTVNRLSPRTAAQVFAETLADRTDDETELQALAVDDAYVRAVNGEKYKASPDADGDSI